MNCLYEDCKRPIKIKSKNLCMTHYMRERRLLGEPCTIEDCSSVLYAKEMCESHYKNKLLEDNPQYRANQRDAQSAWQTENSSRLKLDRRKRNPYGFHNKIVSYPTAHKRLWKWRGKAKDYLCIDCGEQANHWSLNKNAKEIHYGNTGRPGSTCAYSLNMDDYDPRCFKCHGKYDSRTP